MMTSYKDQFTEWSPAYPVFFHGASSVASGFHFNSGQAHVINRTLNTHNIIVSAINKAMKK